MVCFRAWAPRCTTAAVGPKSAPRWGVFRGVRWVCGGIYMIVIHRGYTAGGVISEKMGSRWIFEAKLREFV